MIQQKIMGRIVKSLGGFYYVAPQSGGPVVECRARGAFRQQNIKPCVGDWATVELTEQGTGYVVQLEPRSNSLVRPPLANLDQLVLVVSIADPAPNAFVLDKLIAIAEYQKIEPVIVITKCDLADPKEFADIYRKAGFAVYETRTLEHQGIQAVMEMLKDKTSAFCGNSGAGKSTLLNALTDAGIPARNRLFDTLDTTTRTLEISDTCTVLISDTVGFIRKLPHHLVEAFKATLEELEYADLLLHVIDVSNPQWQQQAAIVEDLIHELKADQIPCIRVYNKCDVAFSGERSHEEDAVSISAKTGEGIPALMEAIDRRLDKGTHRVVIHLPYDKAGMLDSLYREAKVEDVAYQESIDVTAVCPPKVLGQLKDYIEGWTEPKEDWE